MAKDKPEKPVKEKSSKKEKKMSKDKVTKVKKEKKDKKTRKPILTPQESDEDSDVSGDIPATKEEQDLSETKIEPKTGNTHEKRDVIKPQINPSRASEESASESSSASSSEDDEAPTMKASKTTVKIESNSLFTIDTNPTPINRKGAAQSESSSESSSSDEVETKESSATRTQASGNGDVPLNRAYRRRLQLIGRQREVIRKSLNITPGSNEKAEELEAALAEWTAKHDSKAATRAEKKSKRKEKDALKLRNKRGKLLKGRRLKERTKEINKLEKKAVKKGIKRA